MDAGTSYLGRGCASDEIGIQSSGVRVAAGLNGCREAVSRMYGALKPAEWNT